MIVKRRVFFGPSFEALVSNNLHLKRCLTSLPVSRLASVLSSRLRTMYLMTVAPSLPPSTFHTLATSLGFGDWLLLVKIYLHCEETKETLPDFY